jgi:hypothetical protein
MIDGMIGIRRMKVGLENDVEKGLEGRETPAQQMLVGKIGGKEDEERRMKE